MSDQYDLFGAWRRGDPATSVDAALSINATRLEAMCLAVLRSRGPHTAEEIADILGLSLGTTTPRLAPLARKGMAERMRGEDGKYIRRPGASGRGRIVWRAITLDEEESGQ